MSQEMKVTDAKDVVLGSNNDNQTDLEHAPRAPSGFQTKGVLKDIDKDGDGFITREEVERFIGEHRVLTSEKKFFKYGFAFMIGMMIVFSFVIAGLTWGVIILTKETTVEDDVMVSSDTGDPIQCANTDIYVHNGMLVARNGNGDNGRRRRLTTGFEEDDILNDDTEAALGVRNVFKKRALSSMMPDQYFKELEWLEIESQSGSFLSLRILAVVRIPSSNALCGTYLKLGTLHGTILLDEFNLYYDNDVNGVFLQTGLIDYSTEKTAHRRQLSSIDHGTMRRLSEDFSLVGFFNAIDDAEWTCQSVQKPSMPSEYSAIFTVLDQCDVGEDSPNQCQVEIPESPVPIPGYGLTTVDGTEYYSHTRQAYVTPEYSALVDTYAHFPDMTFVTKSFPTGVTRMYQFDAEGSLCRCHEYEDMPLRMTLPDEYLLYPLGEVGNNLYRYRLSYMGIKGHVSDGEEWIHIDYFEDSTTLMPKSLISDSNILQVDSMLTGDNMEYFSSSGFDVSDEDFASCSIATKVAESDRYKAYVYGEFEIPENATLSEKKQYENEEASWDWVSKSYPPIYAPPASICTFHLRYFAQFHASYNESMEEYTGLDEFGEWVAAILNIEPEEILSEAAEVEDMNPNGTSYVPYSLDTDYGHNFTFSNFTYTNITWVNGTEPPDRRALLSDASDLMRRQLASGFEWKVKPFIPSVEISAKYFGAMYAFGYFAGDNYHTVEIKGMGCYAKVICFVGAIHAVLKVGSMNQNDYGGYVAMEIDFDGKAKLEVLKLRYDYLGGKTDYGKYTYSGGTHLAAVESTANALDQYRASAGIEFIMAPLKVSKTVANWVRYNAGLISIFAKSEYFEGVGFLGAGKWKTHKSWTYPVAHWGTADSAAVATCIPDAFDDLPVNTWLPPNWGLSVADVYVNMASDGRFYVKLKVGTGNEVLWKLERPVNYSPSVSYYARLSYNSDVSPIATFGIYRWTTQLGTSIQLDLSTCSQCNIYSEDGSCLDENGDSITTTDIAQVVKSPGKIRWRLYGDGNMKIECTYVKSQAASYMGNTVMFHQEIWKTAWESGVHGACAVQAAS